MRKLLLLFTILYSGNALSEPLFLTSYNSVSERFAILDEFANAGVLYLTKKRTQEPERDAFAYMMIELIEHETWKKRMQEGEPPLLSKSIASGSSVIKGTKESGFSFAWSTDGESVALLYKGTPIALSTIKHKYGFSKAVIKETPIVNPWDEQTYNEIFKSPNK